MIGKRGDIDERIAALEDRINGIPEGEIWPLLLQLRADHGLPPPSPFWDGKQVTQEVFRLMRLKENLQEE